MRAFLAAAAVAIWTVAGAAEAGMSKPVLPPPVESSHLPPGATPRPVTLARAVISMKDGELWRHVGGVPCFDAVELRWSADKSELDVDRFKPVFNEELAKVGYIKLNASSLFEETSPTEEYQVGLRITNIKSYACANIMDKINETMLIDAEWQIYDPVKREVMARVQTSGGAKLSLTRLSDVQFLLLAAVRENTRALLADTSFRQVILSAADSPSAPSISGPITLAGAKAATPRPISDVAGSVVALFTGAAMGSGFLVSKDGFLITNHHVVGSAKTVRVRWSDGFETTGEVIRADRRRDVALVKTDPHGRPPLALQRGAPTVGDRVFAVGTPLKESLQNTVTQGIVSANRMINGFAFIQSDVVVDHGNSGGPLLDERGRVIGITEMTLSDDDTQRGLNAFIPIGDALDFLALKTGP
ncbi:S1C family serine protease [Phenylobacterium sp.]|jgi:S1-C subfamily serine protease|uniref:S1C family serine protease n=1 Tax=Phenylobacterium sp. TaxID=1871053 RepID=UPI002F409E3B